MMSIRAPLARAVRFSSGTVRRDLFGYEQSSEVGPWNDKISKVKFWNDAGELLVEMNRANCPPDLSTFKAVLESILRCPSKYEGGVTEGESKFCAMMDALEEMTHRNGIKPDAECWNTVMESAIEAGDFRVPRALVACTGDAVSKSLIDANEKVASTAASEGKEFPAALTKQSQDLFEIEIKAQ